MSFGIFLMPETKGKHFEDIADDFAKRTAADLEERVKEDGEEGSAQQMLDLDDRVKHVESAAEFYRRRSSIAY